MDFPRHEHLTTLNRQRSGVGRHLNGLLLDRNERVIPYEKSILEELYLHLIKVPLHLYPDVMPLYHKLAAWLGLKTSNLYMTEGVTGAIKSIMESLVMEGDNVVYPKPTFAMYPIYSQMFNVEGREVGFSSHYELDMRELYSKIDSKTKLVFLPNPTVPIENVLDLGQIEKLALHCKKNEAFLVMDEVFFLMGAQTALPLISQHTNILVMRSFSKAFGLASIRLGFIAGHEDIIQYISQTRAGSETNGLTLATAEFFLDHIHVAEDYIAQVKAGAIFLKSELLKLNIEHHGGAAGNFCYLNFHDKVLAEKVITELALRKVYVRGGWEAPFDTGFTVTLGPIDIMAKFALTLKQVIP